MAKEVENLEVLITANTAQISKQIAELSGKLKDLSAGAAGISDKMGGGVVASAGKANIALAALTAVAVGAFKGLQALAGMIKSIVGGLISLAKTIVASGASYTRLKVATEIVARNVGITTENLKGLRDALEDSNTYGSRAEEVIKTLALSGLVDMAKGLSAVDARSGETKEGVTALVLAMKDLAAAAGIDSSDGMQRITKFVRTGNASFADGIIEIGNLTYVYQAYARTLGITTSELTEQDRATARLNVVMSEGQKAFGAYAATNLTGAKAMASFRDAMTSTFERLGSFLAPAIDAAGNAFYQFAVSIRQSVLGAELPIQNFAARVAGYIVGLVRIIGIALSRLPVIGKNFQNLANFTVKPVTAISSLSDALDQTTNSANNTAGAVGGLKKELAGLAGFDEMNVLSKPDAGASNTASNVGINLGGLSDMGTTLADNSKEINAFADGIEKKFRDLGKKLADVFEPVRIFWEKHLKPIVDTIWEKFGDKLVLGVLIMIAATLGLALLTIVAVGVALGVVVGIISVLVAASIAAFGWLFSKIAGFFALLIQNVLYMKNNWSTVVADMKGRFVGFFTDAWNRVLGFIDKVKAKFGELKTFFSTLGNSMKEAIKIPVNFLIRGLNSFIRGINKIRIPSWVPSVGGKGFSISELPYLATGGIVTSPTLAMMGEGGNKEAVLPLDQNTGWAQQVASLINGAGGGTQATVVVKIGEDTIYEKMIDWVNDKNTLSNTSLIRI